MTDRSIDKLTPGNILAKAVMNSYGQTLIPSGVKLEERHLKILKTWNIKSVHIADDLPNNPLEISDEIRTMAEKKLKARLKWEPESEFEHSFLELGIICYADKIAKNNA